MKKAIDQQKNGKQYQKQIRFLHMAHGISWDHLGWDYLGSSSGIIQDFLASFGSMWDNLDLVFVSDPGFHIGLYRGSVGAP